MYVREQLPRRISGAELKKNSPKNFGSSSLREVISGQFGAEVMGGHIIKKKYSVLGCFSAWLWYPSFGKVTFVMFARLLLALAAMTCSAGAAFAGAGSSMQGRPTTAFVEPKVIYEMTSGTATATLWCDGNKKPETVRVANPTRGRGAAPVVTKFLCRI
jgi:hypothetical protein